MSKHSTVQALLKQATAGLSGVPTMLAHDPALGNLEELKAARRTMRQMSAIVREAEKLMEATPAAE